MNFTDWLLQSPEHITLYLAMTTLDEVLGQALRSMKPRTPADV